MSTSTWVIIAVVLIVTVIAVMGMGGADRECMSGHMEQTGDITQFACDLWQGETSDYTSNGMNMRPQSFEEMLWSLVEP